MAAVIRLSRRGSKKNAFWRICVFDRRQARDSRYIESLGHYDPKAEPMTLVVNKERAQYWLGVGAQPSETVRSLLKRAEVC